MKLQLKLQKTLQVNFVSQIIKSMTNTNVQPKWEAMVELKIRVCFYLIKELDEKYDEFYLVDKPDKGINKRNYTVVVRKGGF